MSAVTAALSSVISVNLIFCFDFCQRVYGARFLVWYVRQPTRRSTVYSITAYSITAWNTLLGYYADCLPYTTKGA